MAIFIRLLASSVESKGEDLKKVINSLQRHNPHPIVFDVDPNDFTSIYGSPFSYWVSSDFREKIKGFPSFEPIAGIARRGPSTGDDTRRLRAWWEISPNMIGRFSRWVPYPKGGNLSPFHSDIPLVVAWDESRRTFLEFYGRPGREIERPECLDDFFKPGLTWPRRASRFAPSVMPSGCIFSVRGQAAIADIDRLPIILGVFNSKIFDFIFKLSLGRFGYPEFIAGVLQRLPWVEPSKEDAEQLADLALKCFEIKRDNDGYDETTHIYRCPMLLNLSSIDDLLIARFETIIATEIKRKEVMASMQSEIDRLVALLYDVTELADDDYSLNSLELILDDTIEENENRNDEELDDIPTDLEPSNLISDLLMWCVGVAFSRWDVRKVLDPSRLPELPGPFDPLPVCSPGMLTGSDGLPMRQDEIPSDYPLPVAWDGFLVDDPDHPRDIVSAVESTLKLFWPDRLEEVSREACKILGVPDLRTWFRDPKGFFAFHTKRYSKSRRKAPIYWPLQSAKRSYTIWLYYPHLNSGSLYHAGREYADTKLKLETGRLVDWQRSLVTTSGSARKIQERKIASQEALVDELKAFVKALNETALLELKPDLNDGVLLNVAPLQALVPWKEASRAWGELVQGKYEWSSIGEQLRQKGLVQNTNKSKEAK